MNLPDRLPPFSDPAEKGVLGCVFLNPQETMPDCIDKIPKQEVFYDLRHQVIWSMLVQQYNDKAGYDLITIHQKLADAGKLEAVGGLTYLASLPDKVPSSANLKFYLDILIDKYHRRTLIRSCTDIVCRAYEDDTYETDELIDEAERQVLDIRIQDPGEDVPVKDLVHKAINYFEEQHARQGALSGLSTGFIDLDKILDGLHPEMIVIAARPSLGKTSLAMNMCEAIAIDQHLPVGVFSLEMSKESLVQRMICSRARVNMRNMRDGFLSERDFPKITSAAGQIASKNIWINDISGLSIQRLQAKARRMFHRHGIKCFIIDYLQLLHSTSRQAQNSREREVADISSGIKQIAKDLGVPVIVLSQLNRDMEKRKGAAKRPTLADLRESGSIEQDADVIGLLYKSHVHDDDDEKPNIEQEATAVSLDIAKQRNGPLGTVHFTFLKHYTRFELAAKISDDTAADTDRGYKHPLADA